MNENGAKELLDDMLSALEAMETQTRATLQFLKAKGMATDDELAPHFEQAANFSNVKWRAARVRMESLLASALKSADQDAEKERQAEKEEKVQKEGKNEAAPTGRSDAPEEAVSNPKERDSDEGTRRAASSEGDKKSADDKKNDSSAPQDQAKNKAGKDASLGKPKTQTTEPGKTEPAESDPVNKSDSSEPAKQSSPQHEEALKTKSKDAA